MSLYLMVDRDVFHVFPTLSIETEYDQPGGRMEGISLSLRWAIFGFGIIVFV